MLHAQTMVQCLAVAEYMEWLAALFEGDRSALKYALHNQLSGCCNLSKEALLWWAHHWSQVATQVSGPNIHSNGDLLSHRQSLYWVVIRHLHACKHLAHCCACLFEVT